MTDPSSNIAAPPGCVNADQIEEIREALNLLYREAERALQSSTDRSATIEITRHILALQRLMQLLPSKPE